jgi:murein L,D-transpeptidase YafK
MSDYNYGSSHKYLFARRMPTPFRKTCAALAVLASAAAAAGPLTLDTERVSMSAAASVHSPAQPATLSDSTELLPQGDHIVVHKAERRLFLMQGSTVLRTYRVALGLNPVGQKERAGDSRTPEGKYYLTRRNPRSDYFLSIQVSYPNDRDVRRAHRNRWNPGGSIMIHGLPNQPHRLPDYYESQDWTDGCIGVSNSDMLEIWLMTPDNVPIEILP